MSELTGLTPLYVSSQLNFIPSLEALDLKVAAERAAKRGLSRFSRPLIHFRFYRISNLNHLLPPLLLFFLRCLVHILHPKDTPCQDKENVLLYR